MSWYSGRGPISDIGDFTNSVSSGLNSSISSASSPPGSSSGGGGGGSAGGGGGGGGGGGRGGGGDAIRPGVIHRGRVAHASLDLMAKQYREAAGPWVEYLPVLTDREPP